MRYCLDTWGVIEWLRERQPVAARVREILDRERALMSWINLGEVAYVMRRERGASRSAGIVADLRGVLTLDPASPERVLEAAAIKAERAISYADCFAIATALAHDAVLLTGDPEILDADAAWPVEDLRPGR